MPKLRTAIYARHSTDKQNPASSSDQIAACAELVKRHDGVVVVSYADPVESGYRRSRPGLKRLLADVRAGKIDMIASEALDRLARDPEDVSWLGKKLRFDHVRLVTVNEGEIDEIKLAVAAMLGSMFLSNLQTKTLRGMKAAVLAGRFAGGRAYGYRRVNALDPGGEPVRGVMEVVAAEAAIVQRIYTEFAAGRSPIQIAIGLNLAGVPGPRGGQWNASTIRGDPRKMVGILNNPLYLGRLVWNRREWRKDPDSDERERRYRLRDRSDWVEIAVPDLRIVDAGLAAAVEAEMSARSRPNVAVRPEARRRAVHLLSGLIVCGTCGANYTISGKDYYRCAGQKERGTCGNTISVRTTPLEDAVLSALKEDLLTPELAKAFVAEFRREAKRLGKERGAVQELAGARLKTINKEIDCLAANLLAGVVGPTIARMLADKEAEREILVASTSWEPVAEPIALPTDSTIVALFAAKVERLRETVSDPTVRSEAVGILRDLLVSVTVFPYGSDGPEAELTASPSRMIAYASTQKSPRRRGDEGCSITVVAGTRFHRHLRSRLSHSVATALPQSSRFSGLFAAAV